MNRKRPRESPVWLMTLMLLRCGLGYALLCCAVILYILLAWFVRRLLNG
jgi:hypothetical protein